MTPRKPNSAKRKIVKVRLGYNRRRVFANIPELVRMICVNILWYWLKVSCKGFTWSKLYSNSCALDFYRVEDIERKQRRSKFV